MTKMQQKDKFMTVKSLTSIRLVLKFQASTLRKYFYIFFSVLKYQAAYAQNQFKE